MPLRKEYKGRLGGPYGVVSLSLPFVSLSHTPPNPSFSILSCHLLHSQARREEWLSVMTVATGELGSLGLQRKALRSRKVQLGLLSRQQPHSSPHTHTPHYRGTLPIPPAFPSQESWLLSPPCVQSYGHNCPTGVEVSTETSLLGGGRR